MKNKISFLIISFVVFLTTAVYSQSSMLENGFSLKFSFGFPPVDYGYDGDLPISEDPSVSTTFGLEIGNQWYLYTSDQFGVGLDVNWFDIVYGRSKFDDPVYGEFNRHTLEGSFLEFGPVATFAVNNLLAFEGYYNLRPTYLTTLFWQNEDDNILIYDFGFLHGLGLGARIKFIFIGYEYTFGNMEGKLQGWGMFDDVPDLYDKQPMNANNSKLIIGFQF